MNGLIKLLSRLVLREKYIAPGTNELSGQVIIITGASKGIGYAVAEVLLKAGCKVVLIARSRSDIKLHFSGVDTKNILQISADVTSEKDMDDVIKKTVSHFGKIDVLINNAGQNIEAPLDEVSVDDFSKILDTNVKGVFIACKKVLPIMKLQKGGTIINIGSKISHNTNISPNKVVYATSKYALEGFTFALNKELKKCGIRAICLMPGTVNTFISRGIDKFMSPYDVASVVLMVLKLKNIDFEGLVFKSVKQDI